MDKYVVKLLYRAYRDLDDIYAYIAETLLEPGTAQKLLDALEEAIFSLVELPRRGAPRKNGAYANKGYRQLFIRNFTVVYRVDEAKKQVIIVTVNRVELYHQIEFSQFFFCYLLLTRNYPRSGLAPPGSGPCRAQIDTTGSGGRGTLARVIVLKKLQRPEMLITRPTCSGG